MDREKFSARLKLLRECKGVSAEIASLDMNLDKNCVWLWESGKRKPEVDSIIKLVNYFGCTAGYLIGTED